MSDESWTVEEAIPKALLEQIEFLRQSPALNNAAESPNPLINMFAFLHIVRQLKVTRRTGWVDFKVANAGMSCLTPSKGSCVLLLTDTPQNRYPITCIAWESFHS